ncbi:hypothetical protein GHA09_24355 [Escherichia coli]|nr:hypothetical protein [Escherichia coli]
MVTITVSLVRVAFSSMVQPGTGFPVPSFSTPEICTGIFPPHKNAHQNRRAVITLCYLANQNL